MVLFLVVNVMRFSCKFAWWRARRRALSRRYKVKRFMAHRDGGTNLTAPFRPPLPPLFLHSDVVEKDLSTDLLAEFLGDNLKAYQANGSSVKVRHKIVPGMREAKRRARQSAKGASACANIGVGDFSR